MLRQPPPPAYTADSSFVITSEKARPLSACAYSKQGDAYSITWPYASTDSHTDHEDSVATSMSGLELGSGSGSSALPTVAMGPSNSNSFKAITSTMYAEANSSSHNSAQQPIVDEQTAYQYAMRYAILLDAEKMQTEARAPRGARESNELREQCFSCSGSESSVGGVFVVKSVSRATGAPNLNNRTPTLIVHPRGRLGELLDRSNSFELDPTDSNHRSRYKGKGKEKEKSKGKGWRSSLLVLGDSAARRLKAEISGTGKLKELTKGRLSSGGSDSPFQPYSERNSVSVNDGRLTPAIIKALVHQLKSAASSPSIHPFTGGCYLKMYEELRVKENLETIGEHGTLDNLVSMFSDKAKEVCRQHGITSSDDVLRTVNSQMSLFVKLLRSVLQSKAHSSREAGLALLKLDDYPDTTLGARSYSRHDLPTASTPHERVSFDASASEPEDLEGPICAWLKQVFHVSDRDHYRFLTELRSEVTHGTAIRDLQMCLLVLKMNQSFAGRPEDFRNQHTYNIWKEREITLLKQLVHSYSTRHTTVSGEEDTSNMAKLDASTIELINSEEMAANFEYIPAHASACYRVIVQMAVAHDVVSSYDAADAPTNVRQLSTPAKGLLQQLAIAWRIGASFRTTCYLDIIDSYCKRGVLPETYLIDSFGKIERIVHLMNPQEWSISQYDYLFNTESRIEFRMLGAVQDIIEGLDQQRPELNSPIKRILRALLINDVSSPIVLKKPIPQVRGRREEVKSVLESSIIYRCDCLTGQCFGEDELSLAPSIDGYARLAQLILNDHERCYNIFAEPILEDGDRRFDIAGMLAEIETEYFWTNLRRHIDQFGYSDNNINIEAAFELCKLINKIERLHVRYSSRPLDGVNSKQLFKATVDTWLRRIDELKGKWVENALRLDSTPAELDIGKHSTSVIDLVTCFSQHADTYRRLEWPDAETRGYFLTHFMKFVCVSFEVYASMMLRGFVDCQSLPAEEDKPEASVWTSMWNIRKYKEQSLGVNASTQAAILKLDQSHSTEVSAEACIKLNNLAIALSRLQEMQEGLGVEGTLQALGGENRPSISGTKPSNMLMSFRVIRAMGLDFHKRHYNTSAGTGARPYVKLSLTRQADSDGSKRIQIGKTRPAPAGPINPRWDESFDLVVDSNEDSRALVEARICTRDGPKKMGFREKTRARVYFAPLSGSALNAGGSVDMVLDLEPAGHLMLQVIMDGECDDVNFYSGRMFRFLERTLSDMQQRVVEQVSTGIREYLRQILVSQPTRYRASRVLGPSYVGIDRGIERSIQFLKRSGHKTPETIRVTQESCCEALIPLIDYLEDNLHTLFVYLYEDTANGVICRTWAEVLISIEDILLPPLHGSSKGQAKPLSETYLSNIYECLDFLKWYFGGGADKDGIPIEMLEGRKYAELMMVQRMYFMTSKELMDAYMHEMHYSAGAALGDAGQHASLSAAAQLYSLPLALPFSSTASGEDASSFVDFTTFSGSGLSAKCDVVVVPKQRLNRPLPPVPTEAKQNTPLLPPRQPLGSDSTSVGSASNSNGSDGGRARGLGGYGGGAINSSSESLGANSKDIRTAIIPAPSNQQTLNRSRSVWAHKNAATIKGFKRRHRMVTDTGDIILRILKLRFDKEATKFVQTQLHLRSQQMQYEVRRAVDKRQA
ncbi:hypothetical protein LPJ66_007183 [Kickxella alabastrina]|uniref:Uncharacterized protein n=1 Tax=Kickxella alabastrina TaxID=61397 RepID=A0ACC1IDB2_9FUNG|nr:hypothetical protein LPJ66_007183 [Kickxella alabastrina]